LTSGPVVGHPAAPPMLYAGSAAASITSSASAVAASPTMRTRPRDPINCGNMCFANSVSQVMLYCPPLLRLFSKLGRVGRSGKAVV